MISRGVAACPIAVELAIATEKATANIIEPATPAIGAVWTGGVSFRITAGPVDADVDGTAILPNQLHFPVVTALRQLNSAQLP
jgi:hypothetical protein